MIRIPLTTIRRNNVNANVYFRLRFDLVDSLFTYLRLKIVCLLELLAFKSI